MNDLYNDCNILIRLLLTKTLGSTLISGTIIKETVIILEYCKIFSGGIYTVTCN